MSQSSEKEKPVFYFSPLCLFTALSQLSHAVKNQEKKKVKKTSGTMVLSNPEGQQS